MIISDASLTSALPRWTRESRARVMYLAFIVSLGAFLGVWLAMTLFNGANQPLAKLYGCAAILITAAAVTIISGFAAPSKTPLITRPRVSKLAAFGAGFIALWLFYQWVVLQPIAMSTLRSLDAGAHLMYVWPAAVDLANPGIDASISLDRHGSAIGLVYAAAQCAALVACVAACRIAHIADVILYTVASAALLQLGLVLLPDLASAFACHFETRVECAQSLFGSYINRNHQGALLAMGFAVFAARGFSALPRAHGLRHSLQPSRIVNVVLAGVLSPAAVAWVVAAVMITGMMSSASRAPVVSAAASVLIVTVMWSRHNRLRRSLLGLATILTASAVLFLGTRLPSMRRLSWQQLLNDERWQIWSICLDYFKAHWLWGTGAGSFANVFPAYRDGTLRPLQYGHAHNDYLEFLLENGVIGSTLFAVGGGTLLYCVLSTRLARHRPHADFVGLAAALGCVAMLVHASVDFVFQVPANALAFMMLLGCGIGLRLWPKGH